MLNKHPHPLLPTLEQQWMDAMSGGDGGQQSQRHQMNDDVAGDMQRESMAMQPYDDLELIPSTLIFDYLQQRQQQQQRRRPWMANDRRTSMSFDSYDDENVNGANDGGMDDLDVVSDGIKLAFQPMVVAANGQSDERHETTMKKPINLSGHEGEPKESLLSSLKHHKNSNNDFKLNDLATLALNEGSNAPNDNSDDSNTNANNNNKSVTSNKNGINDDNQVERYLYHLHKNHLTRK